MVIGSIAVVLAAGGCASDDKPGTSPTDASAAAGSLCERIGTEALRKVMPTFEPDPPGEGEATACVRPAGSSAAAPGDFLRITVEDPSPGTDEVCANLERDSATPGTTWMPADHLRRVGDFACGSVVVEAENGVLVTVLSRRGGTHVSISFGRTPGEVTAVREAVIELAGTVMRKV